MQKLWDFAPSDDRIFKAAGISHLPGPAQRYLKHSISPGTPLSHAVQLRMHGDIKLRRWLPFKAEQIIAWEHGFIWRATVRMFGMPILGFDRLIANAGAMRWKLFGIIPVMTSSGHDITRSAAGRINAESIWLPSVLCDSSVSWTDRGSSHPHANFIAHTEKADIEFVVDDSGQLKTIKLKRWGNPDGAGFRYLDFGAIVEEESNFGGYTIPTHLRVGWHFGSYRFESEGEFFRVKIDDAKYK